MRHRAKLIGAALAVALLVPTIAAAAGGSGGRDSQANRQFGSWRTTQVSTTSTKWLRLTGVGGRICAVGAVAATVSVYGSGAPMQLELRIDWGSVAAPGPVVFSPARTGSIASFTFVTSSGPFEGNDHHVYLLEWRSLNGQRTTVHSATMNVVYQKGSAGC